MSIFTYANILKEWRILKIEYGVGKMPQWVKILAAKTENLSSRPEKFPLTSTDMSCHGSYPKH